MECGEAKITQQEYKGKGGTCSRPIRVGEISATRRENDGVELCDNGATNLSAVSGN